MTARIDRTELETAIRAGEVVVVDALPAGYYEQQHLPGAVNLVEADVAEQAQALLPDRSASIVTYCSSSACGNSEAVARRLEALGYTRVRTYREGIQHWVEAGLPTESSAVRTG